MPRLGRRSLSLLWAFFVNSLEFRRPWQRCRTLEASLSAEFIMLTKFKREQPSYSHQFLHRTNQRDWRSLLWLRSQNRFAGSFHSPHCKYMRWLWASRVAIHLQSRFTCYQSDRKLANFGAKSAPSWLSWAPARLCLAEPNWVFQLNFGLFSGHSIRQLHKYWCHEHSYYVEISLNSSVVSRSIS